MVKKIDYFFNLWPLRGWKVARFNALHFYLCHKSWEGAELRDGRIEISLFTFNMLSWEILIVSLTSFLTSATLTGVRNLFFSYLFSNGEISQLFFFSLHWEKWILTLSSVTLKYNSSGLWIDFVTNVMLN